MIIEAGKWNYDARLLSIINKEFKRFGLPTMPTLHKTRARIITAMFSQSFTTSFNDHEKFNKILNKMRGIVDAIKLDEDLINSNEMSRFYEWAKI